MWFVLGHLITFKLFFICLFFQHEDDRLLGDDNEALVGFSWRGGSERETTGVLLWSKPYICTLPNGEEVWVAFVAHISCSLVLII